MYATKVLLFPDYDVGFTVLTTGGPAVDILTRLTNLIAKTIHPVLEQVAHEEAIVRYQGSYEASNQSIITITAADGPGLELQEYTYNGYDMFEALGSQFSDVDGATVNDLEVRLYPTGLTSLDGTLESWRAYVYTPEQAAQQTDGINSPCDWGSVDSVTYGGRPLDEFWIRFDQSGGNVTSIEPTVWQTKYTRSC